MRGRNLVPQEDQPFLAQKLRVVRRVAPPGAVVRDAGRPGRLHQVVLGPVAPRSREEGDGARVEVVGLAPGLGLARHVGLGHSRTWTPSPPPSGPPRLRTHSRRTPTSPQDRHS